MTILFLQERFIMRHVMFIVCALISVGAYAADKPNILVIMADDLGYGDVSCNGATALTTPNIDRLAKNGLRFTSGYCSASTCTPTRYSFLTGRFAFRDPGTGIAPPNATLRIKPGTETIASLLKRAGYATAVIGKWHLGLGEGDGPDWNGELKPGPLELGFDHCYLLPTTNDRVPQVYVEDHRVPNLDPKDPLWVSNKNLDNQPTAKDHPELLRMKWSHGHNQTIHNGIGRIGFYGGGHSARFRDEDLADAWVKQSVRWIEANKDKPFFLFFASHDIHVPRMPHERFQGSTKLGYRGDAIMELDWCVGELTKTLERLNLDQNTLIVFCSDNGPVLDDGYVDGAVTQLGEHNPSGELSGGKYTIFEGGTRTPFVTYWPGRIKPGVSDKLVCTIDLPASMAALAGVTLPQGAVIDSFNVLDALLGEPDAEGRPYVLQQPNAGNKLGLRIGPWKLMDTGDKNPKQRYELYDLSEDLGEKVNLADKYPQRVQSMANQIQEIRQAKQTRP